MSEKDGMQGVHSVEISATNDVVYGSSHVGLRRVLTYGTYDLIVALSTDEFNALKGKKSFYSYEVRREMLEAIRYVDLVIPETHWEQKASDVERYCVDVVCMGGDWKGDPRFEALRNQCEVVYLDRTDGISTTEVKGRLGKDSL